MSAALESVARALGPLGRREVPIGTLTTYRLGGAAALYVEVGDEEALERCAAATCGSEVPVLVLGNGSNMLVADTGFAGLCVRLVGAFSGVESSIPGEVLAGGALPYPVLARRCATEGLAGMSWAVGIPGSVGGAVAMNAGGHGSATAEHLVSAEVVDLFSGRDRVVTAADLALGYRRSNLSAHDLVTRARFALEPSDRGALEHEIAEIVAWRRANQPGGRNGGSVFTNPEGDSAGRILEVAGLKGHRLGGAVVSGKHANFIQADESARAEDVFRLICELRALVAERTGIELAVELRLVGFAP